ncbi:hypothetical protein V6N12_046455 [Hibiscus sabdariffa]|uniref:Uncharacterized protein n=1 Tax=Hibiscus sabdariffa TaxID=183260 RepID=A0ABR2DIP5_9ROSI
MEENVLRNKTKSLMKVLWSVMPKFHRFRDCNKTMYSIALGTGHWQSNRLPYSNGSPLFHLPISFCKGGEWDIGLLSREENTYGF